VGAGPGALGHTDGGQQLPLGLVPAAPGQQHAPVQGAAAGVQERAAVAVDEPVGDLAPLGGPLQVAGQVARDQHVAAGDDHGVEPAVLAAEGAGHGLVDQGHALGLPAGRDQRDPEVAEGAQLQEPAQQPQPALERAGAGVGGHPLGPGQPAPGHGVVVEVRGPGDAEEHGRPGRPGGVPGPPEPGIGTLGGGHGVPGLPQPPQGHAQPVQRLGGLGLGQGGPERSPGLLPPAARQRLPAGRQVVLPAHGAKYAHRPGREIGQLPDARPPGPVEAGPEQATRTGRRR